MTAEATKPFIEEALGWARETADTTIPMLLFVDRRITVIGFVFREAVEQLVLLFLQARGQVTA